MVRAAVFPAAPAADFPMVQAVGFPVALVVDFLMVQVAVFPVVLVVDAPMAPVAGFPVVRAVGFRMALVVDVPRGRVVTAATRGTVPIRIADNAPDIELRTAAIVPSFSFVAIVLRMTPAKGSLAGWLVGLI